MSYSLRILDVNAKRAEGGRPPVTEIMLREYYEVEDIVRDQIKQVKPLLTYDPDNIPMGELAPLPRARFNLDGNKLAYYPERVEAWRLGKRIAPITIDMALTQKCSYGCTFCYAGLQQNKESPLEWEVYEGFLDDCTTIGHAPGHHVKGVSLVSDGESTESPYYLRFIREGKKRGIAMASGTNGARLKDEELPELVDSLTYLRFNFDAAEPQAYAQIMGTSEKNFYKVVDTVRRVVQLKKERGSNVTIGLQQVLLPQYADQVIPLSLLGKELGVDYTVIKHCSDDENGSLGVDYNWYRTDIAQELLRTAEALSTPEYSVQAKWSKIRTGRDRTYSKCYGTPFLLQMSGTGIVAPCGSFFHEKYGRYHIGHIEEQRFRDIWASDKYWEVMTHLGSDRFDPRRECATLCLQDKVNEQLYDLVEKSKPLPDVLGKPLPPHVEFI